MGKKQKGGKGKEGEKMKERWKDKGTKWKENGERKKRKNEEKIP